MTDQRATGALPARWWSDKAYLEWVQSEILRLTAADRSAAEISEALGVASRTVTRVRARGEIALGTKTGPHQPKPEPAEPTEWHRRPDERALVYQSIEYGVNRKLSAPTIARELGIGETTVKRHRARMQA